MSCCGFGCFNLKSNVIFSKHLLTVHAAFEYKQGMRTFCTGMKARDRIAAVLYITLFVSYVYFLQNPWNHNSVPRIALDLSIIEDRALSIDKYKSATKDIAYYHGRYYSDKAPGLSFTALPVVVAARSFLLSRFSDAKWLLPGGGITKFFIYLQACANVLTTALITASAALAIYYFAVRLGAGLAGAAFGAVTYGLATPAWGWATAFFSHNAAAGCSFLGLTAVYFLSVSPGGVKKEALIGFAAGALLSWSVVIELTSGPVAVIIAVYGIYAIRGRERRRLIPVLISAAAGVLILLTPLLIYNYSITGSVFNSLYKYSTNFPGMRHGFYGITYPRPDVAAKLLFLPGYGLFWLSPVLLASPYALYRLWRGIPGGKALALVLSAVPVYYFLLNASYEYWTGGGSTGPRFLTPAIPFLCLPLPVMWAGAGKNTRAVLLVLLAVSILVSLMCVSFNMTYDFDPRKNVLADVIIPGFVEGKNFQISPILRTLMPASLAGEGGGQTALLPLYAVFFLSGVYVLRQLRKQNRMV